MLPDSGHFSSDDLLSDRILDEVCATEWGVTTVEDWATFKRNAAGAVLRIAAAALIRNRPDAP